MYRLRYFHELLFQASDTVQRRFKNSRKADMDSHALTTLYYTSGFCVCCISPTPLPQRSKG